jgi:hypothetical protein
MLSRVKELQKLNFTSQIPLKEHVKTGTLKSELSSVKKKSELSKRHIPYTRLHITREGPPTIEQKNV